MDMKVINILYLPSPYKEKVEIPEKTKILICWFKYIDQTIV